MTKKEIWDDISRQVDNLTDTLGLPVDTKIKQVVVGLNSLGIYTYSSCEGHCDIDHISFPYVGSQMPSRPKYRYIDEEKIINNILDKYCIEPKEKSIIFSPGNELAEKEYFDSVSHSLETLEYYKWDSSNYYLQKKVFEIISLFNSQSLHTKSIRIIYGSVYPGCLIEIQNDDLMTETLPKELLKEKILEAQKEMNYFADFLKKSFFAVNK